MILTNEKTFKMKIRDMENAFKYRRIPYPKRSVELIALLAISCTFFLFMHTNKLNSRLREMEIKLQPSEFSALGLTGEHHISENDLSKPEDINTLHGTYQYLKSTGQRRPRDRRHRNKFGNRRLEDNIDHNSQEITDDQNEDKIEDEIEKDNENEQDIEEEDDSEYDNSPHQKKRITKNNVESLHYDDNEFRMNNLNNTKKAEIELVIFNRVPKVGSQSLMHLMKKLGRINGFTHRRDIITKFEVVVMKKAKQEDLISDIMKKSRPLIFSKHVAFVNFTKFQMPKPIYINLVRDPIERIISWHYYVRSRWYYEDMAAKLGKNAPPKPDDSFLDKDLDSCVRDQDLHCQFLQGQKKNPVGDHRRQTLFFCGHDKKVCMPFNSEEAMQRSKRTVEEEYAVVGTWEDTNVTLKVFEHYIPRFFQHATATFYLNEEKMKAVNKNPSKKPISNETREILRRNLTREIEFYEFCKQRLYLQYGAIQDVKYRQKDDYDLSINAQDEEMEEYY